MADGHDTDDAAAFHDGLEALEDKYTPVDLRPTEEIFREFDDETFCQALLSCASNPVPGMPLLFETWVKQRVADIKQTQEGIYQGIFLPGLHRLLNGTARMYDQRLDAVPKPFDPYAFTDAHLLLRRSFPPRRWLIPGLIADGLTILGGSPKSGKSYLAYELALATVQAGAWCHHWSVESGKVIYVALEDDDAESYARLQELDPTGAMPPGQLLFLHGKDAIPAFHGGALEWVEQTLALHQPRLLIIDPISYLYSLKKSSGSQFEETKDMLFPLRWLGKTHGCAILCIDHRRKRSREDVSMFDTLYGSVAKQAVADALIMIERDEDEITMEARVRVGKDQRCALTLTFEGGMCSLSYKGGGEEQPTTYGELRAKMLSVLQEAKRAMGLPEMLAALGMVDTKAERNRLYVALYRAHKAREIEKTTRGQYFWNPEE